MNKIYIEFKKWHQLHLTSAPNFFPQIWDQRMLGQLSNAATLVRFGQFLLATLLAGGFFLLHLWSDDGVRFLVTLSATSALVYIGLATQSRTRGMVLLNLIAVPVLFATSSAGLVVDAEWLLLSFVLHGSIALAQGTTVDKDLLGGLICWSVFNLAMALLLLLG